MAGVGIVGFLLIGLVAGFLAGKITTGGGFGLVGNLVVGVVGAVVGGFTFSLLGFQSTSLLGALLTATAGAVILLFLISLIKR
jgi:uncharacterized membrane protein YeaQ/YmgE (transglycosylase-associated protein family)